MGSEPAVEQVCGLVFPVHMCQNNSKTLDNFLIIREARPASVTILLPSEDGDPYIQRCVRLVTVTSPVARRVSRSHGSPSSFCEVRDGAAVVLCVRKNCPQTGKPSLGGLALNRRLQQLSAVLAYTQLCGATEQSTRYKWTRAPRASREVRSAQYHAKWLVYIRHSC